jgi:hypothetical protein
MPGREVVEYSGKGVTLWRVTGPGRLFGCVLAVRSPLTGAWLVQANATGADYIRSWRVSTLVEARRSALAGNGRLTGGHSEVTRVESEPTHAVLAMAGV